MRNHRVLKLYLKPMAVILQEYFLKIMNSHLDLKIGID
jgi:hypothetical protein